MEGTEGTKLTEQALPCWTLTLLPRWRPVDQRDRQDHITLSCFLMDFCGLSQNLFCPLVSGFIYLCIFKKVQTKKILMPLSACWISDFSFIL